MRFERLEPKSTSGEAAAERGDDDTGLGNKETIKFSDDTSLEPIAREENFQSSSLLMSSTSRLPSEPIKGTEREEASQLCDSPVS